MAAPANELTTWTRRVALSALPHKGSFKAVPPIPSPHLPCFSGRAGENGGVGNVHPARAAWGRDGLMGWRGCVGSMRAPGAALLPGRSVGRPYFVTQTPQARVLPELVSSTPATRSVEASTSGVL